MKKKKSKNKSAMISIYLIMSIAFLLLLFISFGILVYLQVKQQNLKEEFCIEKGGKYIRNYCCFCQYNISTCSIYKIEEIEDNFYLIQNNEKI